MHASKPILLVLLTVLSLACADRSITAGVDSEAQWSRRLAATIPIGTPQDSAKRIMERNGFTCMFGADSVVYVGCDKMSARFNIVRRNWRAILNMDKGRVFALRASTGLIGP